MQISFFDGKIDYCLNKPIRLIELFAGYGSQSKALEELGKWGLKFQNWKICEWAVKSIQAYKDLHFANNNTDYSRDFTFEYIAQILFENGISSNYNEPMTLEQIKRLGEKQCRNIYNNCVATNNLVNIQKCTAEKLEITDTDKYDYILTYSFPCQDLSKAGLQKGMEKGSGTRSGMLWEVERILDELNEMGQTKLPRILLMENVPDVIGSGAIKDFAKWLGKLESLGYKCYWRILNAKDFGIPQNRERCFMISVLGDYFYGFPQTIPLKLKLKDLLEDKVDEKFYLSNNMIKYIQAKNDKWTGNNGNNSCINRECACTKTTREGQTRADTSDYICDNLPNNYKLNGEREPITCELRTDEGIRTFNDNVMGTLRTIDACGQKHIIEPTMKEQLCDRLVESGLLKVGDVINHSYTNGLTGKNPNSRQFLEDYVESTNGICNTLTTRPDVLGIAVDDLTTKNKRLAQMVNDKKIDVEKVQAIDIYNQTTHDEMHTIKTNIDKGNMTAVTQNLRIRKLTPKECFRLMGIKDEDFEKIAKNQSNASLYHLVGDSIVVSVLVAIFGQMIKGFDFNEYIKEFYKNIKGE